LYKYCVRTTQLVHLQSVFKPISYFCGLALVCRSYTHRLRQLWSTGRRGTCPIRLPSPTSYFMGITGCRS